MSSAGYGGPEGPIVDVREGMRVVDRGQEDVGTVEAVRMGDPEAVTRRGQDVGTRGGLIEDVRAALAGNDPPVPPEIAERLLRIGYVKIDGTGILDRDFYVLADQVAGVSGDVVRGPAGSSTRSPHIGCTRANRCGLRSGATARSS